MCRGRRGDGRRGRWSHPRRPFNVGNMQVRDCFDAAADFANAAKSSVVLVRRCVVHCHRTSNPSLLRFSWHLACVDVCFGASWNHCKVAGIQGERGGPQSMDQGGGGGAGGCGMGGPYSGGGGGRRGGYSGPGRGDGPPGDFK